MDAELKAKWTAALRSGDYKQSRLMLRHQDKYCCLGVLCMVSDAYRDTQDPYTPNGYEYANEVLTETIAEKLMLMNDNENTFAEIADYIDANL